jgi:predicted PurR-regulated permease PerM
MTTASQVKARIGAAAGLSLLGLWILQGFLAPLAWAVVLGLATWPLYDGLRRMLESDGRDSVWPAVFLTLILTVILFGPVTYGLVRLGQEAQSLARLLQHAHQEGLPAPSWLENLPRVGPAATEVWNQWLGTSESARDSLRHILSSDIPSYTRHFASQIFHRYAAAFFTLVVLFFVFRNGATVGGRVLALCDRAFGDDGSRYARHAATAVRATVNGIVLVALGQGIALGFGYAAAGFGHAALLGVVTGLIALIPFAAKIMAFGAALVLFAEGSAGAGIGLLIYGLVIILGADNYLKPKLIGDAVKLPFIWTLLGILGGIETFGLLGLFLGPTIMAILMSVWRDSVANAAENSRPLA